MNKKKIIWSILLVIFVILVICIVKVTKPRDISKDNTIVLKNVPETSENNAENDIPIIENTQEKKQYKKVTIPGGVLYSENGEVTKSDKVIGTEYFDTTINDMYLYPDNYIGMNIEIEGLYLATEQYSFVGRRSTTSACPYCSGGFSYIPYLFDGEIEEELIDQESWIKVIGTWEKGKMNYGTIDDPYYRETYYLKVTSFEILDEKGEETVKN